MKNPKAENSSGAFDNLKGEKIIENIKQIICKYQEIIALFLQKADKIYSNPILPQTIEKNQRILKQIFEKILSKPDIFIKMNIDLSDKLIKLIYNSMERFLGNEISPLYFAEGKDRRFKDEAWQENIFFDFVKQVYIMSSGWWQQNISSFELSTDDRRYFEFISKQIFDAISPSNFAAYNPTVLKEILDSDYSNIVAGLNNLLNDLKNSYDILSVNTANQDIFKLGENIAATKGKVLAENDLMQLICYEPKDKTYSIPILITPPWIKKYYILDLTEENSFVKWLVNQNYQVFMISWVNPNKQHANKNFENYMQEGILFALDYLTKTFKYEKINTIGYCIGGTLLASTLAFMAAKGDKRVHSATFLTTLLDFSDTGDFSLFTDEASIAVMEKTMQEKGYFDSRYMDSTFNMIRANDMIWSFVINNYLLGKQPMPIDILYWNADSTNLPASMYSFYLNNMYLNNRLKDAGGIKLLDEEIDLRLIKIPAFFLSTREDHITPWQTTYKGASLLSGPVEFCLAASGHVAGVVNPPKKNKYSYQVNKTFDKDFNVWQSRAKEMPGSWWSYHDMWLKKHSGQLEKSMNYNNIKNFIEPAPGRYVKVRCN